MRLSFLLCVLLTAAAPTVTAQVAAPSDSVATLVEIELRDGSRFVGTITSETETSLVIVTTSGTEYTIDKSQVVSRRSVSGRSSAGEFRRFDPNTTRLMFGPTGRSLAKGQGYLSAYYIVFGFAAYAPTDRLTLAGGTFLIPQLVTEFLYVAPKLTLVERGNQAVSVGLLAGFVDSESGGIAYGAWTAGQPDRAATVGLGFAFGGGEFQSDPVLMLGGELGMGRSTKLIVESYLIPTAEFVGVLGGVRFFGARLAADLGLIGIFGSEGGIPAFPWVSFAYNFGD